MSECDDLGHGAGHTQTRKRSNVSARSQLEIINTLNALHGTMMGSAPPMRFRLPEIVDRPYLRGSDMPMCPLKFALDTERAVQRTQHTTLMKDFYTSIGTVFHTMMQRWFGVAGVMYGKFMCPKCKKLYPEGCTEADNVGMLGPMVCKCESIPTYCDYVEFNPLNIPKTGGYRGHCDGVLLLGGKYIVLEIKTTSTDKVRLRRNQGPDKKHEVQAQSYRYVLPKFLETPEDMWWDFVLIIYYSRSDPRDNVSLCLPYAPEKFEAEIHKVVSTKKKIKLKNYHLICGTCKKQSDDPYCQYNMLCFSPQRDKLIDEILPGYLVNKNQLQITKQR